MTRKSDISVNTPTSSCPEIEAEKKQRQQQREQTLAWISSNALSTFRLAWHNA
jgi:hypothetical protein